MQKKNKSALRISKKKNLGSTPGELREQTVRNAQRKAAEAKPQKTAAGAAKAIKYKTNLTASLATRATNPNPRSAQERLASKIASKRASRGGMPNVAQAKFSTTDQFRKTRKALTIAKKKAGY
jgi:hypothetical protein